MPVLCGRRSRGTATEGNRSSMTRYVIGPDVAIRLARDEAVIRGGHQIPAPVLLRSQVLSLLYQAVRRGEMTRKDAERQLEYVRGLRIRLLGDRVLLFHRYFHEAQGLVAGGFIPVYWLHCVSVRVWPAVVQMFRTRSGGSTVHRIN